MLLIKLVLTPICDDPWASQEHKIAFTSQLFSNIYRYFSQIFWTTWDFNLLSPRLYSSLKKRFAHKIFANDHKNYSKCYTHTVRLCPTLNTVAEWLNLGYDKSACISSSAPSIETESLVSATKRFRLNLRPESIRWLRTISPCCLVSCSECVNTNHESRSFKTPWSLRGASTASIDIGESGQLKPNWNNSEVICLAPKNKPPKYFMFFYNPNMKVYILQIYPPN